MKAYITKYWFSKGILEIDGELDSNGNFKGPGIFESYHVEGLEWLRTMESAIVVAEKMRIAKMLSLNKQLMILENLKFT